MQKKIYPVTIIGSGPAGYTAAIYTARARLDPLVFTGNTPGGQLMGTTVVENWPGNSSILGPELMRNMQQHAEQFKTKVIDDTIIRVDFSKTPFTLTSQYHGDFHAQTVIIATGAQAKRLGCPGEEQFWGHGVTVCATCDGALYKDKKVIVVGGGDTALEDASFLRKFTDQITIVHILDTLTASKSMQERVLKDPKITIVYNSTVSKITGTTQVSHVTITNTRTQELTVLPADGIFVAIGLNPATEIFKNQLTLTPSGHIMTYITPQSTTGTSIPGVFAAGDAVDSIYRQAITSAGTGCQAALDAERYIRSLTKN